MSENNLNFDVEDPEENETEAQQLLRLEQYAKSKPPREANCWDVVAVVSGLLICALIIFGVVSLIAFIASLNEIEPEPVIQEQYDCSRPGAYAGWCPPPASDDSSDSTYTPPATPNTPPASGNSSNSSNLTVYNQTIDGNLTVYNQTIDNSSNLTEFD